jgi:hypothetical protein
MTDEEIVTKQIAILHHRNLELEVALQIGYEPSILLSIYKMRRALRQMEKIYVKNIEEKDPPNLGQGKETAVQLENIGHDSEHGGRQG